MACTARHGIVVGIVKSTIQTTATAFLMACSWLAASSCSDPQVEPKLPIVEQNPKVCIADKPATCTCDQGLKVGGTRLCNSEGTGYVAECSCSLKPTTITIYETCAEATAREAFPFDRDTPIIPITLDFTKAKNDSTPASATFKADGPDLVFRVKAEAKGSLYVQTAKLTVANGPSARPEDAQLALYARKTCDDKADVEFSVTDVETAVGLIRLAVEAGDEYAIYADTVEGSRVLGIALTVYLEQ
jgi:hypothetical protein